jgi:hypothetical protein
MEHVEIKKVIEDLKVIFETETQEGFGTTEQDGKFHIDKRHFERYEVLGKLQQYFKDRVVKGGYIRVSPITMVITTFEVLEGEPV